jgi:hypothetical protein
MTTDGRTYLALANLVLAFNELGEIYSGTNTRNCGDEICGDDGGGTIL